jgi:hypothetical protein
MGVGDRAGARGVGAALLMALCVGCGTSSAPLSSTSSSGTTSTTTASSGTGTSGTSSSGSSTTGSSTGGTTASTTGSATGGFTALHCPDGGFAGLSLTHGEQDDLAESCIVVGDLAIGGSSALNVGPNIVLTVVGNVYLSGTAIFTIDGGVLGLANQEAFERNIIAVDDATFAITAGIIVTNPLGTDNLTSVYSAAGHAQMLLDNAFLSFEHNWLLADLFEDASLTSSNSNVPNEIYLGDRSTVAISGPASRHGLWLRLTSGTSGTLDLPNASTDFTWSAGSATGLDVGWNLTVNDAQPGLAIESHAGSSWTVVGADAGVKDATIGLFLDPPVSPATPVTLSQLPLGIAGADTPFAMSFPWSSTPQLTLQNVNLGPLAWQIYVGSLLDGGPVPVNVQISDSAINEVGVTAGQVDLLGCNLQLAVLAALNSGAVIHAQGDDIWSQSLLARNGGVILLDDSNIHGSLFEASTGGQIEAMNNCVFWADGNTPSCDLTATFTHMALNNGRPLCSPFSNPMQLSRFHVVDPSSTIDVMGPANQACLAVDAGSYTPAIQVEQDQNPVVASGAIGSVSCTNTTTSVTTTASFSDYPFQLYRDSVTVILADAGYDCTVTAGTMTKQFAITAPSCVY